MDNEILILKDQSGKNIEVTKEQYLANRDLFDSIIDFNNMNLPSWLKERKGKDEN